MFFVNCTDCVRCPDRVVQLTLNRFEPRLTAYRSEFHSELLEIFLLTVNPITGRGWREITSSALPWQVPVRLAGRITARGPGRRRPCCCAPGCPVSPGRSRSATRTEERATSAGWTWATTYPTPAVTDYLCKLPHTHARTHTQLRELVRLLKAVPGWKMYGPILLVKMLHRLFLGQKEFAPLVTPAYSLMDVFLWWCTPWWSKKSDITAL